MPSSDGGDDFVWVFGPAEGPRVVVGLSEVSVDCGLERDERVEDAALEALFGEFGEDPLESLAKTPSTALSQDAEVGVK